MTKTIYANIIKVETKNLVSGDKETRLILSVVGADIEGAILLAGLPIEARVKLEVDLDK